MRIDVTQEDIDNGIPGDTAFCPIVLALKRHIPEAASIEASDYIILIMAWYQRKRKIFFKDYLLMPHIFLTPKKVGRFIRNFDIGGKNDPYIKPFSFELNIK